MPRYSMVAPTFTPIDYATRVKPLEQYKEEYDKRLDALDEQGVLADAIGGLIDRDKDPKLAAIYDDFNNRMTSTASNLLKTGDLGSSRAALTQLRRDYSNKLVPIQTAFNARAEDAKTYRDRVAKDDSYIGIDPLTHSLEDYMHGNMPNDKSVSGMNLYTLAMKDSAAASARNILYGKWGLDRDLLNQYFGRKIITGFSESDVQSALKYYMEDNGYDPNKITGEDAKEVAGALKTIQGAVDRAMSHGGYDLDKSLQPKALGYALQGAITGITYNEKDDYKSYDPAFWLKADNERLKNEALRGRGQSDVTDNKNTSRLFYSGNAKLATTTSKALTKFDEPIIDKKTGAIVRNALDAYYEIKKAQDAYNKFGSVTSNEISAEEHKLRYIEAQKKYRDELNRVKKLYKDVALSEGEYNEIKRAIGFKEDNMTIADINDAAENNWNFIAGQPINAYNIANDGFLRNVKDDIMSKINRGANSDANSGVKTIFKTSDGITADGKAIKYDSKIFDKDNIESIDITPFGVAQGMVLISTEKDGQYLVPIRYMGNEAGSDVYEYQQENFASYLSGKQNIDIKEILDNLGLILHDLVATTQKNIGHNFYQPQGTTSKTPPTPEWMQ